jgi:5-methylcytosine-specific restriction endonuclease McrA
MKQMGFDDETKLAVWEKGSVVPEENDTDEWRKDQCGALMKYSEYGKRNTLYGWEIDHITSKDHGGEDIPSNLRPLHWQNNTAKGSGRLKCAITTDDQDTTKNITEALLKRKY